MLMFAAGIAGVYDIETHYQYEYGRGVAELSTMKRAIGGRHKFQSQSPALILNAASGCKARVRLPDQATGGTVETSPGSRCATVMRMRRCVQPRFRESGQNLSAKTTVLSCCQPWQCCCLSWVCDIKQAKSSNGLRVTKNMQICPSRIDMLRGACHIVSTPLGGINRPAEWHSEAG